MACDVKKGGSGSGSVSLSGEFAIVIINIILSIPFMAFEIFNNYSSSPNGLLSSEAMRARGIIVLAKSNQLVKNIETKQLSQVKARL